jgi:hypothetical protein
LAFGLVPVFDSGFEVVFDFGFEAVFDPGFESGLECGLLSCWEFDLDFSLFIATTFCLQSERFMRT